MLRRTFRVFSSLSCPTRLFASPSSSRQDSNAPSSVRRSTSNASTWTTKRAVRHSAPVTTDIIAGQRKNHREQPPYHRGCRPSVLREKGGDNYFLSDVTQIKQTKNTASNENVTANLHTHYKRVPECLPPSNMVETRLPRAQRGGEVSLVPCTRATSRRLKKHVFLPPTPEAALQQVF